MKALYGDFLEKKKVSIGLSLFNQEVHVTKSAGELLFDGYQDDMIDVAIDMAKTDSSIFVPYDRFGWFYGVRCLLNYFK